MNELLKVAIKASIEAGIEIMEVYGGDIRVELKENQTPLTVADVRANRKNK